MIQKTEVIVLRRMDFRETSVIFTLFSRDFGKIKGLAKGVRIPNSRWLSPATLFSQNAIVFYEKKGLHLITEAELLDSFSNRWASLKKYSAAMYFMELLDLIMPLEDKNEEIYDMALDTLRLLEKESDIQRLVHIFEIKLLSLSGFTPRIDSCVCCKGEILRLAHFSNRWGGLLCEECFNYDKKSLHINHGTVSTLNHILKSDNDRVSRLKMTKPIKSNLGFVLRGFLAYHLDRFPQAYAFMQKSL
jgi:DNA repair protein RecO (recombination protein O)